MKKKQNFLQKLGAILNTSSETFMLIALVGLFAMPFVIAKNLEPVVRESEASANRAVIRNTAQRLQTQQENPVAQITSQPEGVQSTSNVLGVETSAKPLNIEEDSVNLRYFDTATSNVADTNYSLNITTTQVFGKIPLFNLTNNSTTSQAYRFNALDLGENLSASSKSLFIDNSEYLIGTKTLPEIVNLKSGERVTFSLISNQSTPTNVTISVELAQE